MADSLNTSTSPGGIGSYILQGLGSTTQAVSSSATEPHLGSTSSLAATVTAHTGSQNASITSPPKWRNGTTTAGRSPDNGTIKTSCAYTDWDCYATCSSYASACENSFDLWNQIFQGYEYIHTPSISLTSFAYSTDSITIDVTYTSYVETLITTTFSRSMPEYTWFRVEVVTLPGCTYSETLSGYPYTQTVVTSPYTVTEVTYPCPVTTVTVREMKRCLNMCVLMIDSERRSLLGKLYGPVWCLDLRS